MRALQRIRHQRVPRPRELGHIHRAEDWTLRRKKWFMRARRAWATALFLALVGAAVWFVWSLGASRLVLSGLVQADLVQVHAPALVRVAEVFVQPGAACRKGEPLLRLEALEGENIALRRLEVEHARQRLELARLGEDLGVFELGRRLELASRAELEIGSLEAELEVALARLDVLQRERGLLELDRRLDSLRDDDALLEREALLHEAELRVVAEENGSRLSAFDADANQRLHGEGLGTGRAELEADVRHRGAEQEIERARAARTAARESLANAAVIAELGEQRLLASLAEVDARVRAAEAETQSAWTRQELWRGLLARRVGLLPEPLPEPARLRQAQIALFETELRAAEIALELERSRRGERLILAECDGVVDRLEVRPGTIVEAQELLVQYFDPETVRVMAYAPTGEAFEVEAGKRCSVVFPGDQPALEARVAALGASLQRLPAPLRAQQLEQASARQGFALPLLIEYEAARPDVSERGWRGLRPNMPVRVVLRRGS